MNTTTAKSTLSDSPATWRSLTRLLLAILVIKALFFAIDWRPGYCLGDTQSYIGTATQNYIPADRSFVYGFLIKLFGLYTHSLEAFIAVQVFLSGIAAWLIPVMLARLFKVRYWIAALCGLLCAIEPLQLMMERFIMTEAVANFTFACYFAVALFYLRVGRPWILAVAQVLAVCVLSIRISFFPQIIFSSILLPLLAPQGQDLLRTVMAKLRHRLNRVPMRKVGVVMVHMCVSIAVYGGVVTGYEYWYGSLIHRPPKLFYEQGYFLLVAFMPIVEPQDCTPDYRSAIFNGLKFDTHSTHTRSLEHWIQGEVIDRIRTLSSNPDFGPELANQIAVNAVQRDPLGAFELMWRGFADYFNKRFLLDCLEIDQGINRALPPDFVADLEQKFDIAHPTPYEPSFTKTYAQDTLLWDWIVLVSLLASPLLLIRASRDDTPLTFFCVVNALVFFEGLTWTIERPTARYETSAAWLLFLMVGIAVSKFQRPSAFVSSVQVGAGEALVSTAG